MPAIADDPQTASANGQPYQAAAPGGEVTLKTINKEVDDVINDIRRLENTPPPATDEKATTAWRSRLNSDWDTVSTAVNFELKDNPDNAATLALDALSKVKNNTPEARGMQNAFSIAVGLSQRDGVHEETLDLLSQEVKAAEKNPSSAADPTHGFSAKQRSAALDAYVGELQATQNQGQTMDALNSAAKLLSSPELKGAKDTGAVWNELSQLTAQASSEITNSQSDEKLQFRRLDLKQVVADLDNLSTALPPGDSNHKATVNGLLKEDMYPAALRIRQELVDALGDQMRNWQGDEKPGIIQRFEVQDVPSTPSQPTPGVGAKPQQTGKAPDM